MATDSRTATAQSSKARPSWRDRHLNQLSREQLDEVKRHREEKGSDAGAVSDSIAQLSGIDSAAEPAAAKRASRVDLKTPVRQAGPERDSRSQRSNDFSDTRADDRATENDARQARDYEQRQRYRPERHPERPQEHAAASEFDDTQRLDRDQRVDRRDDHRSYLQDRDPESSRARSADRGERVHHNRHHRRPDDQPHRELSGENRTDSRQATVASEATPAVNAPVEEVVNKKGFVATVLDYQMPRMLKYGLMAVAIAILVAVSITKPIDNSSQSQLDSAFTRAMIGFGLARTLNGVISVAQGTEFAVQPAGVGVNFSPGEILDPINDLVERFSWVMLLATSSLGIQKILLDVSSWAGISVLLAGAGLFFLLTRLRNSSLARMADVAGKLLLLMLLVRFLIPVGSLANDWVYKQFLQPQYEQSAAELEVASSRIREISTRQTQTEEREGSITARAKNLYNSMTSKFDFDGMLNDYKDSAENVSEHAINLIVVFTLQTVIFPLLFLYLIYRLFRAVVLPSRSA